MHLFEEQKGAERAQRFVRRAKLGQRDLKRVQRHFQLRHVGRQPQPSHVPDVRNQAVLVIVVIVRFGGGGGGGEKKKKKKKYK